LYDQFEYPTLGDRNVTKKEKCSQDRRIKDCGSDYDGSKLMNDKEEEK